MNRQRIYSREECWKKGGLRVVTKETSLFNCIGETVCPHIVECYRGMKKSEVEGGAEMSDDEIRLWAEKQRKALKEIEKRIENERKR